MLRTADGRTHGPAVPSDEPIDAAAGRLVRLALFDRRHLIPAVSAHLGILGYAGRPPAGLPEVWSLGGPATRSGWQLLRDYVWRTARAGGPPAALLAGNRLIEGLLPATPQRCALALLDAGHTRGVLHPLALRRLSRMWDAGRPACYHSGDSWAGTLLVGQSWDRQRDRLRAVAQQIRGAGTMTVGDAAALLRSSLPGHGPEGVNDVLIGMGLTVPGSPIAWDRHSAGRLLRPVQQLLAATGPLAALDIHAGLLRARHQQAEHRPDPPSPGPDTLIAWAAEHPGLTAVGTTIDLTVSRADRARLLTPLDTVIVAHLRDRRSGSSLAELLDRLVAEGACATRNSAKTQLGSAPYLRSAGGGRLTLRGG